MRSLKYYVYYKILAPLGHPAKSYIVGLLQRRRLCRFLKKTGSQKRIFYLGVPNHRNLGDLAQYYCISKWLDDYCPNFVRFELEAEFVTDSRIDIPNVLKRGYREGDVIVFQSGYTTQDLGGHHDRMHRLVADNIPNANVMMMPQTVFFASEKNRERTAASYNACRNMLFLARDYVSYEQAVRMFPDVEVRAYPDIVTSLIGKFKFGNRRDQIFLCRRNDKEKFYTESQIADLKTKLEAIAPVTVGDTWCHASLKRIKANLRDFIEGEIRSYSNYLVTITDRYHGTIFSLCAGTPVIIVKTTDHKVVTGADWFKGVYDGYVYVANDLDEAFALARKVCKDKTLTHSLPPYFESKYYGSALKGIFDRKFNSEEG